MDNRGRRKTLIPLLVLGLVLSGQSLAQDKPCVIVSATKQETWYSSHGSFTAERFVYLDSMNLSMSQVKAQYKRKELEKLEKSGVKVIVTNGAAKRTDVSVGVGVNQTITDDLKAAREACQQ